MMPGDAVVAVRLCSCTFRVLVGVVTVVVGGVLVVVVVVVVCYKTSRRFEPETATR